MDARVCEALFLGIMLACLSCSNAATEKGGEGGEAGEGGATNDNKGGDSQGGGKSSSGKDEKPRQMSGLPTPSDGNVPKPSGTPKSITVLDWAGFKAAVTYTFDDANSSQLEHYSELKALGVRMTFYLQSNKSDASDTIWEQAVDDGHELGNHTHSHKNSGDSGFDEDTDAATKFLKERYGVTAYTMAAPYGASEYIEVAKSRFLINRGVNDGLITPNGAQDPFDLNCFIPEEGAPTSDFNTKIDDARTAKAWQVMLVHGFEGANDYAYKPVSIGNFTAGVEYAKSFGDVWIDSMVNVGAYWRAQKAFSEISPATSGDKKTWTWTLPDHFPSGKYLRVKVDGGTLRQGETELEWDSHGYYEIALDEGSVTLSP